MHCDMKDLLLITALPLVGVLTLLCAGAALLRPGARRAARRAREAQAALDAVRGAQAALQAAYGSAWRAERAEARAKTSALWHEVELFLRRRCGVRGMVGYALRRAEDARRGMDGRERDEEWGEDEVTPAPRDSGT